MTISKIVWQPGMTYHITTRGNRRNDVFRDEEDFQVYLSMFWKDVERPVIFQIQV